MLVCGFSWPPRRPVDVDDELPGVLKAARSPAERTETVQRRNTQRWQRPEERDPMHRRPLAQTAALLPCLLFPACGLFSSSRTGPASVDDLVKRVENVYVESELTNNRTQVAVQALRKLTSKDFAGDPVAAFGELDRAVKESGLQAEKLAAALQPMKDASGPVFEQWANDVGSITGSTLRARSQERLDRTRERYQAVVQSVDPALAACQDLNLALRDAVLFLGHDLNGTSLATIRDEVITMTGKAAQLDRQFGDTLVAARAYIDATALPASPNVPAAPAGETNATPPGRVTR
jgi:hypothetical protein